LLAAVPVPLLYFSQDSKLLWMSECAEEKFHFKREIAVGRPLRDLLPHMASVMEPLLEVTVSGQQDIRQRLVERLGTDGLHIREWEIHMRPVSEKGSPDKVLATFHDCTQQSRLEDEMRNLEIFHRDLSHEVRSPLSTILCLSSLAKEWSDKPEVRELGERIQNESEYLLKLFEDILRLSEIKAGKIPHSIEPVDIKELLQSSMDVLGIDASQKSIDLRLTYGNEIPRYCQTSAVRLKQIVLNLLRNAIKYTASGTVRIHATYMADTEPQMLQIVCEDTGMGIPAEKLENIFEPFEQGESSEAIMRQGVGLGLNITQKIVHMLGGEINVESTLGQGTAFTLTVLAPPSPIDLREPDAPEESHKNGSSKRRRMLIVDDSRSLCEAMKLYFSSAGFEVECARSARSALRKVPDFNPDVVILDWTLPDDNGAALLEKMQGDARLAETRFIGLSGHDDESLRRDALNAGFEAFFTKPPDFNRIAQLLGIT